MVLLSGILTSPLMNNTHADLAKILHITIIDTFFLLISPATGMVNYNIAVPFASSVTAAQLSAAILATLNANGSLRAAGMVFTVNPATILVGGKLGCFMNMKWTFLGAYPNVCVCGGGGEL